MPKDLRVELQAEVPGRRTDLFPLVATADGLALWLDAAEMSPTVGAKVRFKLREAVAIGHVIALDPPQHISYAWDWEGASLGTSSVVAFDLIDHAERTHLTVRHVGLRSVAQQQLHDALWRYWFGRLVEAGSRAATASLQASVTQSGP